MKDIRAVFVFVFGAVTLTAGPVFTFNPNTGFTASRKAFRKPSRPMIRRAMDDLVKGGGSTLIPAIVRQIRQSPRLRDGLSVDVPAEFHYGF